ncbi:Cellulose synthase (UDP-forming) [Bertholletia excelsa]
MGTGCFHRREAICGKHYYKGSEENLNRRDDIMVTESAKVLEETCKIQASCSYEESSPWGKEVGVKYGCPLEDIITGLSIQCRGWKSIYFNPEREAFSGVAPMTLLQLSSPWILPFAYVIILTCGYDIGEFIRCGGTIKAWWNDQRMWLCKRTTSYLFGLSDTILKLLKLKQSGFAITTKVNEEEASLRFERETMEFGDTSPMFIILATLALLNLFVFVGTLTRILVDMKAEVLEPLASQIILCWLLIFINLPIYQGLFFRKDKGRMPACVTYQSVMLALLACTGAFY